MNKFNSNTQTSQKTNKWVKDIKANKSLYIMFIPVLLYYIIFMYGPMYGALIAFKDFRPSRGFAGSDWVGFKHFVSFLTSPSFASVFFNTIKISVTSLVFNFTAPIILALMLNELRSIRYSRIVQNLTYLPHFISIVITCGMIKEFTMDTGIVTRFLTLFGFEAQTLLNQPKYFLPVYIVSGIWQGVGWGSIVYLAALTSVDASLIEAAIIDGAGRWRQLISVKLPAIIPIIVTMFILQIGRVLSVGHEKIILLYNDITMEVADVISTFVYRKGLLEQNWSYSTAVNMFNSIVNLILLISANKISRKVQGTSLW